MIMENKLISFICSFSSPFFSFSSSSPNLSSYPSSFFSLFSSFLADKSGFSYEVIQTSKVNFKVPLLPVFVCFSIMVLLSVFTSFQEDNLTLNFLLEEWLSNNSISLVKWLSGFPFLLGLTLAICVFPTSHWVPVS